MEIGQVLSFASKLLAFLVKSCAFLSLLVRGRGILKVQSLGAGGQPVPSSQVGTVRLTSSDNQVTQ